MSSRRILTAFVALLCLPHAATGQSYSDLQRRLEAEQQAVQTATARLHAFDDSVARARQALDSVYVHPFHILVQPELVPLVTEAARLARADLAWTGRAIDRLASRQFVVRRDEAVFGPKKLRGTMAAVVDPGQVEKSPIAGLADDPKTVALWLKQLAGYVLAQEIDTAFRAWLDVRPQFDTVPTVSWTQIRLAMVSLPATIGKACYAGDLAACSKTLGLTPTADPLREWFDAAGRRELVKRWWQRVHRTPSGVHARCVEGDDASCISVLEGSSLFPTTMVTGQRASLLRLAIQMGGPGAMERLYSPAKGVDPAERIARIANAPIDSVIRVWRARVRDSRLPSEDLTPAIGVISLAWIVIFGALSLRSSRWR